ncbi:hypothetical protein IAE19_12175 [Acinetobacter sp. S40]|uniref:hypothetical protein n=1 Tax=Acinetobacter sp. S40 TaxID=2767434 RepID=UPI001909A3BE|nr:hypothetical protein [Acinetobacter sp. S40]MBJ9986188.1 hypothetical protein [Acinetobacter sp. S40]
MTLEQRHNSRLLWIIIGGISILVLLFFAAQWFFAESQTKSVQTTTQAVEAQTPVSKPETKPAFPADSSAESEPAPHALIDESILKTPVPDQASLAKEEVAKLDDIQAQLKEQQSTLKAQHQDADTLIKLKQEQVKLLEAQLSEQK